MSTDADLRYFTPLAAAFVRGRIPELAHLTDDAQVIARGGAAWSAAQAAVANGVTAERPLERDWPVKVAVSERYKPAADSAPAR